MHIDGFIAHAGHTVLVGNEVVDDKRADVILAAWNAAQAVQRWELAVVLDHCEAVETYSRIGLLPS